MKIFLTGKNGGIGSSILDLLLHSNIDVVSPSSNELDLGSDLCAEYENDVFDGIIHCAGINNVKPYDQVSKNEFIKLCDEFRSEHWVIVSGKAKVEIDGKKYLLNADESIYIPKKAKHRLTNDGENDLILVEVWFGDNLKEEDIIRYEDIYDRI